VPAKIRVLPETTINQIAAGEIIENPASLIKELIENSVDAGAKKIEIYLQAGGYHSIEVIDDGCGMSKEDSILCFERHATSKIKTFDDLMKLKTMGFRGEALASIGATSQVEIETAEEGQTGTRVICHGGKILKAESHPRVRGTTIRVNNLFYNVPARKKFQKSPNQSTADIVKMCTKIALAHEKVVFRLFSMNKELLNTSSREEKRIEEVLGKEFLKDTKMVSLKKDGLEIKGLVGDPHNVRTNRLGQYLFINQRPVVSNIVERAVSGAYGTRIGAREFPTFALWIDIESEKLDVNVHPQKSLVKFSEEDRVYAFVKRAVEDSFYQKSLIKVDSDLLKESLFVEPTTQRQDHSLFNLKQDNPIDANPVVTSVGTSVFCKTEVKIKEDFLFEDEIEVLGFYESLAFIKVPKFLPFFLDEALILVDMPRLDTKVQFKRFLDNLNDGKSLDSEMMLFPEVIQFSKSEITVIEKNLSLLKKLGIGIREFGKESFIIESLPNLYSVSDIRKVLELLIEEFLREFTYESILKIVLRFRPQKIHSKNEVIHLLKEALETKDPFYSPYGKIIFKEIKRDEFFG
jgi:DNA mismatch repair protein MutL